MRLIVYYNLARRPMVALVAHDGPLNEHDRKCLIAEIPIPPGANCSSLDGLVGFFRADIDKAIAAWREKSRVSA